jgi:hypothetical protein
MTRAIRAGGWTILLLSTMYGSTVHAQRERIRGGGPPPVSAPAPATPAAPAAQPAAAPQPAPPQSTEVAPSLLQQPARDAQIVFADGNLSIHADNSSLAAILHQVASNSGMKIEGLGGDERVFGNFGPGAPRDVLADLLVGTAYNQVLLGDLNGAPRELILSPATRGGAPAPSPAPQANANVDDGNNEPEAVEAPPPSPEPPAGSTQQPPPGVRTPQQLFEQLQQMRAAQQRGQQQPVQQDSPMQ